MSKELVVKEHVEDLIEFLGLHLWIIEVETKEESKNWAEIIIQDYNEATIKVSDLFWDADNYKKTQILLHELLHISYFRQFQYIEDALDCVLDWLAGEEKKRALQQLKIHVSAAHRAEEIAVNNLSVILAQFAPRLEL